jgi:hypothetical protein
MIRRTLFHRCLAALTGGLLAPLAGCEGRVRFHLNIDSQPTDEAPGPEGKPEPAEGRTS